MNFDEIIERRGTHSAKWDNMEDFSGVSPEDGLPMWVADMEFRAPECVQSALKKMIETGVYGYYGAEEGYLDAIRWWMDTRHGWQVEREAIFSTNGIVNGTQLCLQAYTQPGDGVVMFTPIYHAFFKVIRAQGREVTQLPMALKDGRYRLDFDAYEAMLTGKETMLIFCSPHNPGGRVWSPEELREVAAFARRHDLTLVSDEIHMDIVLPGHRHTPMAVAAPDMLDRLVMMTATTKTFNMAGGHVGNVIVPDPDMRTRFAAANAAFGGSQNSFGQVMAEAAYSPEGAAWVDEMTAYIAGNAQIFDDGINAIPGLRSIPLEGTYLAWVDFSGTGMDTAEIRRRIASEAKIAVNPGTPFGTGGASFQRFNLACQRARVHEAVARMQAAFGDLQ